MIALAILAACGGTDEPSAGNGTPTPTSSTHDEDEWTIVTPAGWTREVVTEADAKKAIRYKNAAGDYFIVAIDPLGSDFSYDVLWRYEVKGSGFEVVERSECTGTAEESCSTDDQRFDGWVLWKAGADPQKVGGHTWYFIFGNTTKTTVDLNGFEQILESITVKA